MTELLKSIFEFLTKEVVAPRGFKWLYKVGILDYPYLDLHCDFGGFKPDTQVFHKKYGAGEICDYAEYNKRDKEYVHSVFFNSLFEELKQFKRDGISLPLDYSLKRILCSELEVVS